ncbi:MAG: hypothetical protein AB2374_07075 [Cytobacillus gottheilii]|uniref:hypothetical protein n=1 Tax=Cytobacillus gottheilii TaxID=859144 RepID=UPI000832A3DA|nr:hypothetical protein [Cytobacillus gottheilii]
MNDSVIIYGGFDFIGFHLTKGLLDEGYSISSVRSDLIADDMLENKRLELGRNANFLEWDDLKEPFGSEVPKHIFFDFYSLYLRNDTKRIKEMYGKWIEHAKSAAGADTEITLLLPVQMEINQDICKSEIKEAFKEHENKLCFIFLPTIYGEWQPEEFAFQQACLKKADQAGTLTISGREWQEDAIYVQYTIKAILDIFEKGSSGDWFVRNKIAGQWQHCAALLEIEKEYIRNTEREAKLPEHLHIYEIESDEEKCEGIKKQKQHIVFNRI